MLSRLLSLLLGFGVVAISFTCPFIRRSQKGILLIHYAFLHAAQTWQSAGHSNGAIGTSATSTLVGSAVLILLLENVLSLNKKEKKYDSVLDALPLFGMIAIADAFAIFLFLNMFFLGNLLIIMSVLGAAIYLNAHPRPKPSEIPISDLDKFADGSFFFDLEHPLNILGRNGWIPLTLVIMRLLLVPYASTSKEVQILFAVAECICTWFILALPAIVGGLIQTIKLAVRHIVEIQLRKRVLEVERKDREVGQRQRRREELLASVEELYSNEIVFAELI